MNTITDKINNLENDKLNLNTQKDKLEINTDKNMSFTTASNENVTLESSSDTNLTNCLALTVKKDYKLVVLSNAIKKGTRMTFKVILSTIVLNILNLFL